LLQKTPLAFEKLLGSIADGIVEILPVAGKEASAVADVMKQYRSLRAQFADAMLVYLANRENIETIFTLDRRDFLVYRSARKPPFLLVPELQ
jgi:predicted nucleic acid-binding protein